jgi:dienelactone hydrolase
MNEKAVWFGATKSLSGVLTEPPGGPTGLPAALLLNAGFLHRVGPNRLYVKLARRLAALGFPVLRFDYSGLGESAPRQDGMPLGQSVIAEGLEAMSFLASSGVADTFVPMGLCWGGENAQRLAAVDKRVVGAALIDGYAYRTPRYYVREAWRHLRSAQSWRRLPVRALALARKKLRGEGGGEPAPFERNPGGIDFEREFPPRATYLEEMRGLLARDVELLMIFTGGGMAEYYNHVGQLWEGFPTLRGHACIRLEYMPLADHTFTQRHQQDALLGSTTAWAASRFASRAADAAKTQAASG